MCDAHHCAWQSRSLIKHNMFLSQLLPIAGEHSSIYLSRESFGEGAGYVVFPSQFRWFHLWTCKENFGKNVSEVFPIEKN